MDQMIITAYHVKILIFIKKALSNAYRLVILINLKILKCRNANYVTHHAILALEAVVTIAYPV